MAGVTVPPEPDGVAVKLDRVATTLIAAVAAVGGLLAVFGVNNERMTLVLDDDRAQKLLLLAGGLAVATVSLSLWSLLVSRARVEVLLLTVGTGAYVGSLLSAMFAATGAADYAGHPSLAAVSLTQGQSPTLSLTVRAGSLDEDQRVGVRVRGAAEQIIYEGTMRPNSLGGVEQAINLSLPAMPGDVLVQTWRVDEGAAPDCEGGSHKSACAHVTLSGLASGGGTPP